MLLMVEISCNLGPFPLSRCVLFVFSVEEKKVAEIEFVETQLVTYFIQRGTRAVFGHIKVNGIHKGIRMMVNVIRFSVIYSLRPPYPNLILHDNPFSGSVVSYVDFWWKSSVHIHYTYTHIIMFQWQHLKELVFSLSSRGPPSPSASPSPSLSPFWGSDIHSFLHTPNILMSNSSYANKTKSYTGHFMNNQYEFLFPKFTIGFWIQFISVHLMHAVHKRINGTMFYVSVTSFLHYPSPPHTFTHSLFFSISRFSSCWEKSVHLIFN